MMCVCVYLCVGMCMGVQVPVKTRRGCGNSEDTGCELSKVGAGNLGPL